MFNKKEVIIRDFFTCQTCGVIAIHPQIAHKIKQGDGTINYLKYWLAKRNLEWTVKQIKEIVNHPLNVCTVCSGKCNDAQNIFFNDVKREDLLTKIFNDLISEHPQM